MEEHDDPIETVEEQAADWIVREDGDGLNEDDQVAFAAWLANPVHRTAYDRHRAVWRRFQTTDIGTSPLRHAHRFGTPKSRRFAVTAIAASAALVMFGYADDWSARLRADYVTSVGERRTVTLADGSTALLGGRSAIAFSQSDGQRTVHLLMGKAVFKVAPDSSRPFRVETDAGSVTALGTAFAVQQRDHGTELVVTEHSVKVQTTGGASAVVQDGESTRFTAEGLTRPVRVDTDVATAWARGHLIVFDRPLGEVVAEIGREHRGYWSVRGDAAAVRVNGAYDLDQPLATLENLEKTFNLKSLRISDRVIILSR